MKVKTNELTDLALDGAVAKAEGVVVEYVNDGINKCLLMRMGGRFNPSTDWAQAGPIIEREWISVEAWPNESDEDSRWVATRHEQPAISEERGSTPLIAAMRCYVAAMLGDEVDIPEELVK